MNSVLQVYLRFPGVSSILLKTIESHQEMKLDSAADSLLIDLIANAYRSSRDNYEDVPVINMNAFRSLLGSEYNTSFPNNEPGDAHSFLNFCHNFLKRIEKTVGDESKVYSSTFQINYLVAFTDEEGAMEANPVIHWNFVLWIRNLEWFIRKIIYLIFI